MIVITSDPVIVSGPSTIDGRNPRIGYHNLVTPEFIFADEETDDERIVNVANPTTYLLWRGETTDPQNVTLVLPVAENVNYFAIAKHNLGSSGAFLKFQSSTDGVAWTDRTANAALNTDYVMIYEFNTVLASYFRLVITPGVVPPSIGVLYIGRILVLQRRVYVGHVPIVFGRDTEVSTGYSENGQFLGRVMRRRTLQSAVEIKNLTPAWVRSDLDPFLEVATVQPFFWAWRPEDYPFETGFAWLKGDPDVVNQSPNGFMSASFRMQAVR